MKRYEAVFKAKDQIKQVLTNAGIKEGITLTPEEIKDYKKELFWYIELKSENASRKETYLTFNISDAKAGAKGDGRTLLFNVIVTLDVFTLKEDIQELIENVNTSAVNNGWDFDLVGNIDYEGQSKLYTYRFLLTKMVG